MEGHFLAEVIQTALVSGTFLTAFAIFMFTRRKKVAADPQAIADVSARLERIEEAVDAIAIEVERVSEGQRFTSRLLAESDRSRLPVKQTTPH